MKFINQFNTFFELLLSNPLSSNSQCLYFTLFYINNKCNWKKEFTVANSTIMGLTGFDKNKLDRARNNLIQRGYIKYRCGKNQFQAGTYELTDFEELNDTASDTAFDTASNTPSDTPSKSASEDINRLDKTREYIDHFELIWEKYPNKQGKAKAMEYYLQWIKGRKISGITKKLTDKQMYYAVLKYAKGCDESNTETRFIKHGDTFFNKAILDYVEAEDGQI